MIGAYLTALLGATLAVAYMTLVHRWLARESALAGLPGPQTPVVPGITPAG